MSITRAQILLAFARDLERGIELPLPQEIVAIRRLNAALAKLAVKNNCTWDDNGSCVRGDARGIDWHRK